MSATATMPVTTTTDSVERVQWTPSAGWLEPDDGETRMPCGDTVADTCDAVALHEGECTDCQSVIYAR